jgi:hypothetical protein
MPSIEITRIFSTIFFDKKAAQQLKMAHKQQLDSYLPKIQQPLYIQWWTNVKTISDFLKNMPQPIVVAATEHGYLAAQNKDKKIIDLSGLHNVSICQKISINAILEKTHPDLLWMPHTDYVKLNYAIQTSPYFLENYVFYKEKLTYGIAIHKKSPYYNELLNIVK